MSDSREIDCHVHGWQQETFVCRHIAEYLSTGIPVGFFWSSEQTASRPDAWCLACERRRLEAGGDGWTSEVEKKLEIKLLCGSCYDDAKAIWSNRRKITQ